MALLLFLAIFVLFCGPNCNCSFYGLANDK
jgi:hypothetical protein